MKHTNRVVFGMMLAPADAAHRHVAMRRRPISRELERPVEWQ